MEKNNAIVIVAKDIEENVITYYEDVQNADVFLLSPNINPRLRERFPNIIFLEDNEILGRVKYPKIEKTKIPNWYYQQFLKYSVVLDLYKKKSYNLVHIVDGDSYIKKELIFEEKIFYTSKIIEKPYNNFIHKLNYKFCFETRNFITNQMCYNPKFLEEMLNKIIPEQGDWIDYFCDLIINNEDCWFSEYQVYANFVKCEFNILQEPIKVFRRLDLINVSVSSALNKYSVVSNEVNHKSSVLHTLRAYTYYILNINLG